MHTCSTSTSPPSSDQRVWWRDRLDLQHDGVVYMVENFCCRASPTNSREGERKVARLLGLGGRCVWGEGGAPHHPSIYRGGAASPCPSSKPISSLNNLNSPLSRNPISSLNDLNSPLSRNSIPRFKRVKSL